MNIRSHLALCLGFLALLACSSVGFAQSRLLSAPLPEGSASSTATETQPPPQVQSPGDSGPILRVDSAQLVCLHKIQVSAQSDGLVDQLLADEGHLVKKGDVLLKIDSRVANAELEVAGKELQAAEKQAAQTAEVEYAKKASAVADEEYKAENELFKKGSSTFSQAQRKLLEAQRSRLGIDVAQVKHETEGLAAEVAKAKLDAAQVRLGLFDVIAPYDGVIVERLRDEGEWIRSGEPVLRLVHMNEMKIEALVPVEGISIADLQNAPMKVVIKVNPQQNYEIPTTVEFISPEIISRRVRVSAKIDNQKVGDTWLLRDGMSASIEIQLRVP